MSSTSLTNSQLLTLVDCVSNGRMGQGINYASTALLLYDYSLTVWDEARFVWLSGHITVTMAAFFLARYGALAGSIIVLLPNFQQTPALTGSDTVLRLISIFASEFLVGVRTWAIWARSGAILILLVFLSVAATLPATIIIGESIASNRVLPLVTQEFVNICSITVSNISKGFVVPYVLTILYEFATLTLSLIRIVKWRNSIPKHVRTPITDTLWRDGVLYFSLMLILGFMNIAIVVQSGIPQVQIGCAQFQSVFHSILSTRMVLHLRDIEAPGCTSVYTKTPLEFAERTGFAASTFTRGLDDDESEIV
jgi:hypothetical protein